jgi:CubicO group peptidase (beta-lactamase class C family)
MHDVMAGYVGRGDLPGLVTAVCRRGEAHIDAIGTMAVEGSEPMQPDTIFRIASMTKPVTAVAAMILVEECRLRLDEPVDRWLPELAGRRVLRRIDGPLDDTVPASRPITLRDLLTLRMGMGHIMAPSDDYPIRQALNEQELLLGPPRPQETPDPDEWMRRLGTLPLMHQPGEGWMYDLGLDVLGVLVARAAGQPLEAFTRERIFEPLGMVDTGFSVPPEKIGRLAASYAPDPATGALNLYDAADGGQWSRPSAFASGASGLVSTAGDYLAFGRMLLNRGRLGDVRILSRPSVELMTMDHLSPEQKVGAEMFFGKSSGWGFGMSVVTRREQTWTTPGRFGWDGGLGTSWASDPAEDMVTILLTQRAMTSLAGAPLVPDFWTSVYQAIDD